MIGYPLGLGAHAISNFPISRSGIIAQIIPNNPFFLIDGITSHGNSGSPVFTVYEGSYKFQGIIKGGPQDFIRAFDENRRLIASLPYNSGLSICISSSTIKKFIYK
jgi:hypothetical protein